MSDFSMAKGYKGSNEALFVNNSNKPALVIEDRLAVFDKNGKLVRFLDKDEKASNGESVKRVLSAEKINPGEKANGDAVLADTNLNGQIDKGDVFYKVTDHAEVQIVNHHNGQAYRVNSLVGWVQDSKIVDGTGLMTYHAFMGAINGDNANGEPIVLPVYDSKTKKRINL